MPVVIHADRLKLTIPWICTKSWLEKVAINPNVSQIDAVEKSELIPGNSLSAAGEEGGSEEELVFRW